MRILCLTAVCLILAACAGPALADNMWPSPFMVPEPGCMLAFSTAIVGLVAFTQRRRR
ncbi:MAG: PEP-CTERM sorting domain-containing protein [Armatimonadota bacterium]